MKQTLESLISALKELEQIKNTQNVIKLEEKVVLIIKELNSLITENNYSNIDKDLKQRVEALGDIIKNLDQNQEQRSKTFAEFMKYLKDRKIN